MKKLIGSLFFLIIMIYFLFLVIYIGNPIETLSKYIIYNAILIIFFLVPGVFIHEFGHAIVGRIVGIEILGISVGSGRRFVMIKAFNIYLLLQINLLDEGTTYYGKVGENTIKIRILLFVTGGILINTFIILLLFLFFKIELSNLISNSLAISESFLIALVYLNIISIIPINNEDNSSSSDGRTMINILKMKNEGIADTVNSASLRRAIFFISIDYYDKAEIELEKPDNLTKFNKIKKYLLAFVKIRKNKIPDSINILEDLIIQGDIIDIEKEVYNYLAWCYLCKNEDSLTEALKYSDLAFNKSKEDESILSTRAVILCEMKEYTNAVIIFKKIINRNSIANRNVLSTLYFIEALIKLDDLKHARKIVKNIKMKSLIKISASEKTLVNRLIKRGVILKTMQEDLFQRYLATVSTDCTDRKNILKS